MFELIAAHLYRTTSKRPHDGVTSADAITWFAAIWAQLQIPSLAKDFALVTAVPELFSLQGGLYLAIVICLSRLTALLFASDVFGDRTSSGRWLLMAATLSWVYACWFGSRSNHVLFNAAISAAIVLTAAPHVVCSWRLDQVLWLADLRRAAAGLVTVVYLIPLLHKLNWDFLLPRVSCATQVFGSLLAQLGFAPTSPFARVVMQVSPLAALLTEAALPLALWRFPEESKRYRCAWTLGVLFHVRVFVFESKLVKGRFEIDMDEFGVDKDVIRTSSMRSIR